MTNFADDLPSNLKRFVEKGNIKSPEDVVTASHTKLLLQGCSEHDVRVLKEAAAKIVAQSAMPVSELLKPPFVTKWSRLSFGCSAIDRCMYGGVPTRGITEICGESGGGKTQLVLQLSLAVQLPTGLGGLGKGVAFVCTEDAFPSKRLFQMAKSFTKRFPEQQINYLSNVYVDQVIESDDLLTSVCERLAKLMETCNIGLIVIDSVAAVFRVRSNFIKRARDMRRLANSLLYYADKYNCAVVCVNQVATVRDGPNRTEQVPCLGLAWAHLGRTRIRVSRIPKQLRINDIVHTLRKFEIMYSPDTPSDFSEFLITENGVLDVP